MPSDVRTKNPKKVLDIFCGCAIIRKLFETANRIWGYSSAGRALEWHSRGQRFDPAYLHQADRMVGFFFYYPESYHPESLSDKQTTALRSRLSPPTPENIKFSGVFSCVLRVFQAYKQTAVMDGRLRFWHIDTRTLLFSVFFLSK